MPVKRDRPARPEEPGGVLDGVAARLRRGDPDAVGTVRRRVRQIIRYRNLAIPDHVHDDLEQEVMTQTWQAVNRPGFDPDAGFWGFVEIVTSRRCIDWLRTRKPGGDLDHDLEDGRMDPLNDALAAERTRLAAEALAALDEPCRELITLRIRDETSFREIAARLGKSEGSLRIQMYRCVRSARKLLRGLMAPQAAGRERLA